MFKSIERYVIRQITGPLFLTLGVAALLLVLERMLRLFDFVINQGGPVDVVFLMLANLLPHYLGLALPVGLFLGVLFAFRKLSMNSELDAILSAGISHRRLLHPVFGLALALMAVNIILTGWVQPISRYEYRELVFDLRSGALGASVRVGEFVNIGDGAVLRVEKSTDNGKQLFGVFLERTGEHGRISVTAEKGGFFASNDPHSLILRMYDGLLLDETNDEPTPRVLTFARQDIPITLPASEQFRERGGEEREYTLPELYKAVQVGRENTDIYNDIRSEFHWRVMHSLTLMILPFLGIAMGIAGKRNASSAGIPIGLGLLIIYNEVMEGMATAVSQGYSPYATIWALFTGFALLSLYMFYQVSMKVGGNPLRPIHIVWTKISKPISRISQRILGVGQ